MENIKQHLNRTVDWSNARACANAQVSRSVNDLHRHHGNITIDLDRLRANMPKNEFITLFTTRMPLPPLPSTSINRENNHGSFQVSKVPDDKWRAIIMRWIAIITSAVDRSTSTFSKTELSAMHSENVWQTVFSFFFRFFGDTKHTSQSINHVNHPSILFKEAIQLSSPKTQ